MSKVTLKNIYKKYQKDVEAVRDISFTAEDGEFVVLVGPSGCGKSTLLRMIAGLEEITSGDLYFNEKRVNDTLPKDRDVGMVFQNYALYPHLTVFENLAFPLSIKHEKKAIIRERVNEIAGMIGMSEYLKRKPKELSGGQRQRVALGRAIVRKPQVFLFDEPLSNLDAKLRVQMRAEISNLHRSLGITSIYVTHDQVEAMTMGTKLVVLKDGEVQQIASPNDIYNNPVNEFVAGFIGSPQINFFGGKLLVSNNLMFTESTGRLSISVPETVFNKVPSRDMNITLALRPEHIYTYRSEDILLESIKAKVINLEYVGHEELLYFTNSGDIKCCRTTQSFSHAIEGNEIELFLNSNKFLAFDENGKRI